MTDRWEKEARVLVASYVADPSDAEAPLIGRIVADFAAALRGAYEIGSAERERDIANAARSIAAGDAVIVDGVPLVPSSWLAPDQPATTQDDADRLLDASTPESEVDDSVRAMGLDPDALRAKGVAIVEALRDATPEEIAKQREGFANYTPGIRQATPRGQDGGAGERCGDCGTSKGAPCGRTDEYRCAGLYGVDCGPPAPVTYRAGTVPPVVRVGMVLQPPGFGCAWTVTRVEGGLVALRNERGDCPPDMRVEGVWDWTLARDFTEPGGECVDCNGEGYLDRDDGQQKCPPCDGTGRTR
jgi:hypothetical protein